MKLLKITTAEFKKIILRPSVIVILIAIFALSIINVLTFKPEPRNTKLIVSASSPSELLEKFEASTDTYSKGFINNLLLSGKNNILSYGTDNSDLGDFISYYSSTKDEYNALITEINAYKDYNNNLDTIAERITAYDHSLKGLLSLFQEKFDNNKRYLLPIKTYNDVKVLITLQLNTLKGFSTTPEPISVYRALKANFDLQNMFASLSTLIEKIKLLTFTTDEINSINDQILIPANTQFSLLNTEVYSVYEDADLSNDTKKTKLQALITQYYYVSKMAISQFDIAAKMLSGKGISDKEMRGYVGYEKYNRIQLESIFTKNSYILANGIYENEYLDAFNPGFASGTTTNAFDFAVYALQFSIILIIFFCLVTLSRIISGEQSSGTIKLVAIRPYSRTKLIIGKLFSVFFLGFFLYALALLFNLTIGVFMYGAPNTNLLITVFNGSKVVSTVPMVCLLIFAGSHLASLLMYVSIGVLMCVFLRSQTASTLISLASFGLCLLLNGVASKGILYKFLPNANFSYYKLFGGTYFSSKLTAIVTGDLPVDVSAIYLIICYLITLSIIIVSSIITYNKKDIA